MFKLNILFLILIFFSVEVAAEDETLVFIEKDEIHYQGPIGHKANKRLFTLFKENKVSTVVIRSKGGEVNLGLDLGEFIFKHKLNVKIIDYCLSSCANYVFTAGDQKILGNTALIGFHGGTSSTTFNKSELNKAILELPEEERESYFKKFQGYLERTSNRELKFYKEIQVKQNITTLGQSKYYQDLYGNKGFSGWYYSLKDLKYLGVNNISVINPPWKFKLPFENIKVFKVAVDYNEK